MSINDRVIIPINRFANQDLTVILGGQKCLITIKQKSTGVFCDVIVDNKVMVNGKISLDRVPLLFPDYRGFIGYLFFEDQNNEYGSPYYESFNDRYLLIWGLIPPPTPTPEPENEWLPPENSFILMESEGYVLQESGDRIILEDS